MNPGPTGKLIIQGVASLGLLAAGVYVLIAVDWGTNQPLVVAATGWIGLVMGYWMK